jgi:hypothetical protein
VGRGQHRHRHVDRDAAGILAQTPAGALIDITRLKRAAVVAAAIIVMAASLLLPLFSNFFLVVASQAVAHASAAAFGPGSRQSRWALSATPLSAGALAATKPSIMPATHSPQR